MSRTVGRQNPDDDFTPKIRASRGGNRLVQYGEMKFKVQKADDLEIMDQGPADELDFDSKAGQKCVKERGYEGIKLDGFIKFDNRFILVFFHNTADKEKEVMWMLKTKLSDGWNSTCKKALNDFTSNEKNDWSRDPESDGDDASETDTQSVNNKNRDKGNSEDEADSEYEESITTIRTRSRPARSTELKASSSSSRRFESPKRSDPLPISPIQERVQTTRSTDLDARSPRNKRFQSKTTSAHQTTSRTKDVPKSRGGLWTREGLETESNETPEPGNGGEVIYGIQCNFGKPKIRGLVLRDEAYDFEVLRDCPRERMIANQNGGMAPKADNMFIEIMKKADKSKFDIQGCAAKWHGRPDKQVIVILNITDRKLKNNLTTLREMLQYEYDGPLVCSLAKYRDKFGEEDFPTFERHLKKTNFALDATKEEISLVKSVKKRSKRDEHLHNMGKDMKSIKGMLGNMCLQVEEVTATG
jgi:hypothetical protein